MAGPDASDTSASAGSGVPRGLLRRVLFTESFLEKFALLVVTALISGIAVPVVVKNISDASAARQKDAEKLAAQNAAIRDAQGKLVDEFSLTVFTYETLAADVSWYQTREGKDEGLSRAAYSRYAERTPDLIARWRSLQTRADALASRGVSNKMNDFQTRMFQRQDGPMNALIRNKGTEEQWKAQHGTNVEMLNEANQLIVELMNDLGIARSQLR